MIENGKLINPEVRIENTSKCNGACVICPREKMTRPKTTMGWGHFVNLVEQSYRLGATDISIFGYGEPLLDIDIAAKVAYTTKRGMETHITTNASLLDMDMCHDLLDAGLKNIRFSVHAITPKLYHNVHRGLDWFQVTKNMFNFIKVNNDRDHPCTVHMTAMPLHGESIGEIREIWEKTADYLEIWKPHNWTTGRDYRKVQPQKRSCGRPFNGPVQINADGRIMVCCFDFNAQLTIGDTHENTIEEILLGNQIKRIQENHTTGEHGYYICATCDQRNVEFESPLLYSNRDLNREIGKTSTCKVNVEGE